MTNNESLAIENFINFCDDMMIAEEGKILDKIKAKFAKKKKKEENHQPIPSDDPEFLSSRKKVYTEIESKSKKALQEIYRKYPKVKQTKAIIFSTDDDNKKEFLTCPNVKDIWVFSWDMWDYTPTARTDEDGACEEFGSKILPDCVEILQRHLGDNYVAEEDGDWDDGFLTVTIKKDSYANESFFDMMIAEEGLFSKGEKCSCCGKKRGLTESHESLSDTNSCNVCVKCSDNLYKLKDGVTEHDKELYNNSVNEINKTSSKHTPEFKEFLANFLKKYHM